MNLEHIEKLEADLSKLSKEYMAAQREAAEAQSRFEEIARRWYALDTRLTDLRAVQDMLQAA